jgi:hypothetical protein
MTEVPTSVMLGWLRALPPEQALVIRERIERDAHEIAELKNDRDEYSRLHQETVWPTK